MNITEMLIQMQRPISSPNGRQKHERNMETDTDKFGFVRITMINERIQKYIEDHSFCSEYLFKDWEAFLDYLYEEGGRVSSIL